jgi:hypothetical protein
MHEFKNIAVLKRYLVEGLAVTEDFAVELDHYQSRVQLELGEKLGDGATL